MIAKMKKLTFLVYHKEYDAFLKEIRDLGVVHVTEQQQGMAENAELQENLLLVNRLNATLKQFNNLNALAKKGAADLVVTGTAQRGLQVLDEVEALHIEKNKLTVRLQALGKDEKSLEAWGDFGSENIDKLLSAGWKLNFYMCSERNYDAAWEEEYNAMIINKLSSKVYFVTLNKQEAEIDIDAEQIKLPADSLSQTQAEIERLKAEIEANDSKLAELALQDTASLKVALDELHRDIEFSKVLLNSEKTVGDKLMLLQGWAPAGKEEGVHGYLKDKGVYYELADPTPDDNVPILLSNKGLFAWFEPICKLYMLPKYGELDLTPFFAPFFMLFFGLCLGDSGYGLFLFLGVTIYRLVAKNIGATMKPVLSLVQVLAGSTFFAGLLTGTFFGFNLYDLDWPFVQKIKDTVALDNNQMFQMSLILGVIQIMFGMILKVVNQIIQFGFKYAVSTLGWVILLLSFIVSVLFPSIMPMGETIHMVVLGVAAVMIFLFNSPDKNIFVNIGLGFWDTYNMATGLLGDILSYVRLFALGLSGGILASVFNSLAVGMSPDNIIAGPIVMLLIFLIGHSINMFMNVLGALVHPMRLTFVEFFKNAGYEGGGKEYKPFKN